MTPKTLRPTPLRPLILICAGATWLSACSGPFDLDLRSMVNGFDTSNAASGISDRPAADENGVISYPTYRVAMARAGETPASMAARLGVDAAELARINGLRADRALREGELLTLPGDGATGIAASDLPSGTEPLKHEVKSGETAFSIARLYDIPVQDVARMNNLDENLTVRPGQQLLIPVAGASATGAAPLSQPGQGSATPVPPSSTTALPSATPTAITPAASATSAPASSSATAAPQPAPQLPTTSASSSSARFVMPVNGAIIRAYARGRNEGVDIAAAPGTAVKAADAGTLAAVTQNTNGSKIAVIKHADGLLTVYLNLGDVSLSPNSTVSKGQTIGTIGTGFDSLHFEVRRGLESVDPAEYLP